MAPELTEQYIVFDNSCTMQDLYRSRLRYCKNYLPRGQKTQQIRRQQLWRPKRFMNARREYLVIPTNLRGDLGTLVVNPTFRLIRGNIVTPIPEKNKAQLRGLNGPK